MSHNLFQVTWSRPGMIDYCFSNFDKYKPMAYIITIWNSSKPVYLAARFKNYLTMNLIENCKNSRFIDLMLGL